MKKRGIVLLIIVVFVLILSVLITASPQDTGCCTNPDLPNLCIETSESTCCSPADDYNACVSAYFFNETPCNNVPSNLCNATLPVCCTDPNDERFCDATVDYLAQCYNRSSFVNQDCSEVGVCQEGCCICVEECPRAALVIEEESK